MAVLATGNQDDALDIVQDGMLDFVRSYAKRPATEWRTLFFRVLQSRIIDWHRRSLVRNRLRKWFGRDGEDGEDASESLEELADPRGETPASLLMNRELGLRLEQAIRRLPLRQQQAFLLRAWEGMDVAETARAMGCSDGSVKTHYSRAVTALRDLLKEFR